MSEQPVTYTLRFDDICPEMDWRAWNRVEALLRRFGVKAALAVVPDNRDPKLSVGPAATDFWERVRAWQADGWTIGLHGFQHVYVNRSPGIIGLSENSEFALLDYAEQKEKLSRGLEIFARNGVRADCWIAPSHSFDWNTVKALRELGVGVISDGLWRRPFTDREGTVWVPQQIGGHRSAMLRSVPAGLWTVCCHVNGWGDAELDRLQRDLEAKGDLMEPFSAAIEFGRAHSLKTGDRFGAWAAHRIFRVRKLIRRFKARGA